MKCINYYCSYCLKHKNTPGIFYTTNHRATWERHIATGAHNKCVEIAHKDPHNITCKCCKKVFTKDQFDNHKKLNEEYWNILKSNDMYYKCVRNSDAFKNVSCNNFVDFLGQRHDCIDKVILSYKLKQNGISSHTKTIEIEYIKLQVVDKVKEETIEEGIPIEETDPTCVTEWRKNTEVYETRDDVEPPRFDVTCYGCGLPDNSVERYKKDHLDMFDVEVCNCLSDSEYSSDDV